MERKKVLFVCTHHGARSRIAEEFVKKLAPGKVHVSSACFEPGKIGDLPRELMREVGIELPREAPESVFLRHRNKEVFDCVISLCHEASTDECPIFTTNIDVLYARQAQRISWSIPDFRSLGGTEDKRLAAGRKIRDKIKAEVVSFLVDTGILSSPAG